MRFLILDVFSERPFGGNQLGVFPDASGVSTADMQSIARELNFSETTFVLPSSDGRRWPVRIFTPRVELPFAGHPTLGTGAALAHEGLATGAVTLEEKAGPVEVAIERRPGSYFCEMSFERKLDLAEDAPEPNAVAAALSLDAGAVRQAFFAGLGVRFCFVELADRATVDAAVLDRPAFKRLEQTWSAQIFFFARQPGGRLYARMFGPAFGVDEDPATGGASAALVAYLAARTGEASLQIEQGVAMGRPSSIHAAAARAPNGLVRVEVGGACRVFASGTTS
ncbi:MAG: PhzF family phenazine biosynthesis protein [Myxococcales bacterium]|nr:PhzF family phenazine biosynthesis protein [Myxococcales bacterium]